MGDLSPHFDSSEFRDRRDGHYHPPPAKLLEVLECIRAITGRPLPIVSGTRSKRSNRLVGGAPLSRHLHGDAADIPAGHATPEQAIECGATGVGELRGWATHVDVRPGQVRRWRYR